MTLLQPVQTLVISSCMPLTYELNSMLSANEREIRSPPLLFLKMRVRKRMNTRGGKG